MDNFNLKKYLVENKVTRNSRTLTENENFSVELLVPTIYFNVETGELAKSKYDFGAESELEDMDITSYSDGEELIEWVFDGSLEKAKYFEREYPGLFKVVARNSTLSEESMSGKEVKTTKGTSGTANMADQYKVPDKPGEDWSMKAFKNWEKWVESVGKKNNIKEEDIELFIDHVVEFDGFDEFVTEQSILDELRIIKRIGRSDYYK